MTTTNGIDNYVGSSDNGLTNTFTVQNTSNTASSQATEKITVGGGTAGDAWTQYSIGATQSFSLGIDNSDSDSLKINTDASGSVNPSSGTGLYKIETSGATTLTPTTATVQGFWVTSTAGMRHFRGSCSGAGANDGASCTLANDTASSEAGLLIGSTGYVPPAANIPAIANKIELFSNAVIDGIVYSTHKSGATHEFYTSPGGIATLTAKCASDGEWTYPVQPAFLGYLASTKVDKTGNGTPYTLGTDALTEVYDRGTDFTTAGVFTAPVNGIYDLRAQVTVTGNTIATTFVISIVTTATTYTHTFIKAAGAQDESVSINALAEMAAGTTATVTITVSGEAGDTSDIKGGAALETYFCGTLVA